LFNPQLRRVHLTGDADSPAMPMSNALSIMLARSLLRDEG
jgi:hypothetical protein